MLKAQLALLASLALAACPNAACSLFELVQHRTLAHLLNMAAVAELDPAVVMRNEGQ